MKTSSFTIVSETIKYIRINLAESYPTSEVWYSGPECQAVVAREQPGGATLRLRSVAAGRRHPTSEVRGRREKPPTPDARAGSREEQPEERWLHRHRRA